MPSAEPQKQAIIFESYAWNDAQEIAKRLTRDLEARGLSVWHDVEKMRNPERWSMEIVEAIDGPSTEIVFAQHDKRLKPRFLPDFLRKAHASGDAGFVPRVFKAIDILSFAYGEHELALGAIEAALGLKDAALEPLILASLANIRLQDQSAVEAFLQERDLDELVPRVAALAPTIRAEDIPTWIDDFVVQWMLTSQSFRAEVCAAFRRAVGARSEAVFLHQLLVWVIGLIAGRADI